MNLKRTAGTLAAIAGTAWLGLQYARQEKQNVTAVIGDANVCLADKTSSANIMHISNTTVYTAVTDEQAKQITALAIEFQRSIKPTIEAEMQTATPDDVNDIAHLRNIVETISRDSITTYYAEVGKITGGNPKVGWYMTFMPINPQRGGCAEPPGSKFSL